MGSSEIDKPAKVPKEAKESKTPTTQEQSSSTPTGTAAPDWLFFRHILLCLHTGSWHQSLKPFAIPSPNGIAEASGNTPSSMEADVKLSEGKEKLPIKRSKGSLGSLNMITGKQ
ncbi:unnamed protein product [Camellia sinensis]